MTRMTDGSTSRFSARALVLTLAFGLGAGGLLSWAFLRRPSPDGPAEARHANELPAGVVEITPEAQKNARIEVLPAAARTLPVSLEVTGTVAVDDAKVAHVRPLARGVVERVSVRLGDRVRKGDALATYDNVVVGELVGEYLSARAKLRQMEADRGAKEQALTRARELFKVEAISKQTLELREAEFHSAEAAVASEEAAVARVEEQLHRFGLTDQDLQALRPGDAASPHRDASHTVLRAPFDGIVTKFNVANGEVVEPERELFTISDLSSVWVLADVYERDLARVRADTDATVRVDTYPDRVFNGRVTYVSDLVDPETRSVKVRCVVNNADGALKLDMFARIVIPTVERKEVLSVPEAAIQKVDGRSIVFVRSSPTRFERRVVETGLTAQGLVEIRSGLKAGEEIVASGSFYLKTALLRERVGDSH